MGRTRQDFEAFFLQIMLGAMMPEEDDKMFGSGSEGKIWRSMLSEQLARQITDSGRLRILPDRAFPAAGAEHSATASGGLHVGGIAGSLPVDAGRGPQTWVGPADWSVVIKRESNDGP